MPTEIDVPYLIVGAGPVGLTAARLLSNSGVKCVVVERRDGPQRNPAAHVVNARTLEIFRQAGFNMQNIAAISQNPVDAGHVNFLTRLNGQLIGQLPFERQGDDCLQLTPHPLRNISQHRLEPLLSEEVAQSPFVDLRYDCEWISAEESADGVLSLVRNTQTGEELKIHSSYLLAADGAGSPVRKWAGIEMIGPAGIQSFVAIHFRGNLRPYVSGRLGALHFIMDPEASGTFIAHDIENESVFMVPFDPNTETIENYGTDRCEHIVRNAIGDDTADIEIVGAGTWHMTAQVAESMHKGRVFLMGDAAHRFPPTGGMGLNTGVADAHNLVWKLLAVESGSVSLSLLNTYESERRPIAEVNCHQSLTNAFKMVVLAEALALHPGATSADLAATLADPTRAEVIAAGVAEQATHFNMLGLQLGYVYETNLNHGQTPAMDSIDPTPFNPTGEIGSRLPHAWVDGETSTLDLVSQDGFTLFSFGEHEAWNSALQKLDMSMSHVRVGDTTHVSDGWRQLCGIEIGGALVVRPDQHIAWRSVSFPVEPSADLDHAMRAILMEGPVS
jgi:2-polyprenyl-6-methoxyphenol hydroxylase-like FAD-dependent oxidoreductase